MIKSIYAIPSSQKWREQHPLFTYSHEFHELRVPSGVLEYRRLVTPLRRACIPSLQTPEATSCHHLRHGCQRSTCHGYQGLPSSRHGCHRLVADVERKVILMLQANWECNPCLHVVTGAEFRRHRHPLGAPLPPPSSPMSGGSLNSSLKSWSSFSPLRP